MTRSSRTKKLTKICLIVLIGSLLTGCAIGQRSHYFPFPVWIWECWEKPSPC